MIRWSRLRPPILAVTCLGILAVLGKIVLVPTPARQSIPPALEFPATVPLTGWQPLASRSVEDQPNNPFAQQKLLSSKLYEYQQNSLLMQIEMRYAIETSGNVMGFLSNYTSIPLAAIQPALRDERHQDGVGYYLVFVNQQRAYLTSCINPQGDSTVTLSQFRHNRYFKDLRIDRLWRWLADSEGIRDDRCLWVNMSIPVDKTSIESSYSVLEDVWVAWYRWWQPRFPKS